MENTVPAILAAGEKGYKYAEFDVRLTEDMVWVVSHDKKIDRMTNGKGKISDYTYFELSKMSNVVATKEANGDISSMLETLALCGDNLDLYTGNDDQTAPG